MKYDALVDVRLAHPFHTDGGCPDVSIVPAGGTIRLLDRHGCLVWQSAGRLAVITPLDAAGLPLRPLEAGTSLLFELRLANDDFSLFTDLDALRETPSPLFTNAHMAPGAAGELSLTSRTTPAPDGGSPLPARQSPGVLAEIEIVLHPGGAGSALPAPVFQVTFRPRQWRWAYYCVTDLAAGGGDLTIVDTSSPGTPGALLFSDESRTSLDEHPDPSDPIAVQLTARHPGMRVVRFLSDEAVPCREQPRERLELRLDGERVASPLPNPSVRSFSRRRLPPPDARTQDQLYQIIEYRAQPFPNP